MRAWRMPCLRQIWLGFKEMQTGRNENEQPEVKLPWCGAVGESKTL